MTDNPKPITTEFVRGARWAATLLANILDDPRRSPSSRFRTGVEWAHDRILGSMPEVSPLAAAEERLGAFLVKHPGWCQLREDQGEEHEDERWVCQLTNALGGYGHKKRRSTEAEAINAALDAAMKGPRDEG